MLNSYSDILNTRRSEIYHSNKPSSIRLKLYLIGDSYNVERINEATADLVNFLKANIEEILLDLGVDDIKHIDIEFLGRNERRELDILYAVWIDTDDGIEGEWEIRYHWRE